MGVNKPRIHQLSGFISTALGFPIILLEKSKKATQAGTLPTLLLC